MTPELQSLIAQTVPRLQGWCSVEKATAMARLILETRPLVVVEIGVYGGRSLIPQALALKAMLPSPISDLPSPISHLRSPMIYGIDPWTKAAVVEGANDPANDAWWQSIDLGQIYAGCAAEIARLKLTEYVSLLKLHSSDAVHLFRRIDILHIDGNHSEFASCRDVSNYMPKVPLHGYIWMDDSNWPTTQAAIRMVEDHANLIATYAGEGTESRLYQMKR